MISLKSSRLEPFGAHSRVILNELPLSNMIFPLFLSATLCLPLAGIYTQLVEQTSLFKHASSFKPNEFQALNIQ